MSDVENGAEETIDAPAGLPPAPPAWEILAEDEAATRRVAQTIAELIGAGDLVTLSGDLGSGKTAFARALIQHALCDESLEVPSPTFTLLQIYEGGRYPIVHADLYRISEPSELTELGWDEAAEGALVLVEWAERAGDALAADRFDVYLAHVAGRPDARGISIRGYGNVGPRLARARSVDELLKKTSFAGARREFMLGDASSRAYERLTKADGSTAVLMISPPRPDGPPVRYGRSYSAIARLAETIEPFVAMAEALGGQGLSAPKIYGADLDAGLAIIEDLGTDGVIGENGPILERELVAAEALATLHGRHLPDSVSESNGRIYRIPAYDLDALLIEIELLPEWYAPFAGYDLSSGARAVFVNLWRHTLIEPVGARATWTLRDYHSPNLIWLAEREGLRRMGLIDFQDCVMGHPAYDVASLAQDARIDVSDEMELRLLGHYAKTRRAASPDFDMAAFARAYAILGAQRATKILGIFARLDKRDGKPQYRTHMPRVAGYLRKNLAHPSLSALKDWYAANLPGLFDAA